MCRIVMHMSWVDQRYQYVHIEKICIHPGVASSRGFVAQAIHQFHGHRFRRRGRLKQRNAIAAGRLAAPPIPLQPPPRQIGDDLADATPLQRGEPPSRFQNIVINGKDGAHRTKISQVR